jgi:tetratricopeptide (TPR) repeat protein
MAEKDVRPVVIHKVAADDRENLAKLSRQAIRQSAQVIEEAIRLDPVAALDQYHDVRAQLEWALGNDRPMRAMIAYNSGVLLEHRGLFVEAESAYTEAEALDPLFLWPANNLAWFLATSARSAVRDGGRAESIARRVCEQSNWMCWAFLDTLAAACAASGWFESAIRWQRRSIALAPDEHIVDGTEKLRLFESGSALYDPDYPIAGGGTVKQSPHEPGLRSEYTLQ